MNHIYRSPMAGFCLLALVSGLSGCATSRTSLFSSTFLPTAPLPAAEPPSPERASNQPATDASFEPARLTPRAEVASAPVVPPPAPVVVAKPAVAVAAAPAVVAVVAPVPSPLDALIRRADEHFQRGKRLYHDGQADDARREFDRAVDLLLNAPEDKDRQRLERHLEDLAAAVYRYDIEGLGSGEQAGLPSFDKAPLDDILELTFPVNPELRPKVREQVTATASQLPLMVNDTVLSYINFFNGDRGRRTLLAGLRRAGKYKPMIRRILAEEGVPQELIFLAQAESGFMPRAVSHAAAVGMWQFMRATGHQYGLHQSSSHDDRLDPEKATRAAARHLRDLHQQFGDWYLAIAAYNCGNGCVDRAVQRTGYADYWELRSRHAIPRETTNYVPIILAMTIMVKNASHYGLEHAEEDAPLEYETHEVASPTHLSLFAALADTTVTELRDLNPALLSPVAPASYVMKLPKSKGAAVVAGLAAVPEAKRAAWRMHRIGQGETLGAIARQYQTTTASILEMNRSTEEEMTAGDVLLIPGERMARATVKPSASARAGRRSGSISRKAPVPVSRRARRGRR